MVVILLFVLSGFGSGFFVGTCRLGLMASLLCLVCWEIASFASLPLAHKTWVSLVCLLLDTSFGRCSVGALPLEPREGMSGSS